jgi:hypothetical protein
VLAEEGRKERETGEGGWRGRLAREDEWGGW